MPNFEVMDGNRFEGDFSLQPVAGYQPNAAEQGYLDQLARVTQALNIDRERDPTGTDQAARKLAEARQNRRQAAIEELRAQADEFCADGLPAASAANHAMMIESRYIGRADFEITDRDRFEGDFDVRVVSSVHPTASERSYINTLRRVTQALAIDKANEPSEPGESAALAEALSKGRQKAADDLRKQADQFCAGKLAADIAADNVLVIKGKYVANRDRLAASLFIV